MCFIVDFIVSSCMQLTCIVFFNVVYTKTGDVIDEEEQANSDADDEDVQAVPTAENKLKVKTVDYESYDLLYDADEGLLDENLPLPHGANPSLNCLSVFKLPCWQF
jgi:hypothetical protein